MGDFPIEFSLKTGHQEKIMGDMGKVNFGMQIRKLPIKMIGEYPVVSPCLGL